MKYDVGPGSPLDMLGEECAEAVKEIFKAYRFGMDTVYTGKAPGTGVYRTTSPRQRLVQEVGDILVSVDLCVALGFFSAKDIAAAKAKKRQRLVELFGHDYESKMPVNSPTTVVCDHRRVRITHEDGETHTTCESCGEPLPIEVTVTVEDPLGR